MTIFSIPAVAFVFLTLLVTLAKGETECAGKTCSSWENDLRALKEDLFELMKKENCNPIMVRLAWHDSGTYDDSIGLENWPKCGGANGSIRFPPEIEHGANAGLQNALDILKPYKEKYPAVSWADLIQMSSVVAIEQAGGPKIPMKYGRVDVEDPEGCMVEGNLPAGNSPFPKNSKNAADHLRDVFYRMGLNDQEITALSGAHTLGRAHKDRSGEGAEKTKYTSGLFANPRGELTKTGQVGKKSGGSSWTKEWLKFDNSYYTSLRDLANDKELLKLETDLSLSQDEGFKPFFDKYANDQEAFFADYAEAHKKLSELGSKFTENAISV